MKTISKMKTILISLAAVAGMVSASTAMASLASVDYTGLVDRYIDNTGTGEYNGVIGSSAVGTYAIDTTGTDARSDVANYGKYDMSGPNVASINVGGFSFSADKSSVIVANDWISNLDGSIFDGYLARGYSVGASQILVFGLSLLDTDADQFSSDSFVAEPVVSNFEKNMFFVAGLDSVTKNLNFMISGSVSTLVDPPAPVPLPAPLLLLGSALAALGFTTRKRKVSA